MDEIITISEDAIVFKPAEVLFPQYQVIKEKALLLSETIKANGTVTEENVKDIKKDLAFVRKISTELNNRRKVVKAEVLSNYNIFEQQIKEIDAIVSEAEEDVRKQVRELEEQERCKKREIIRDMWDKRIWNYKLNDLPTDYFEYWLTPQHLNKTTSLSTVEKEMTEWLQQKETELETASTMGEDYFVEYAKALNLTEAISSVAESRKIKSVREDSEENETAAKFIIYGKKNIKLTEMLLEENEIDHRRI